MVISDGKGNYLLETGKKGKKEGQGVAKVIKEIGVVTSSAPEVLLTSNYSRCSYGYGPNPSEASQSLSPFTTSLPKRADMA